MYLKRLEIYGFKSFAHKTVLEFSQGIIAIVGPNGSGKSNVADALRWVLGEQSAKLMRGKKADDVIFAGSDKKTRLGFAEVVATFDNQDRRIPIDAPEVSLGRRVDRSGNSEYLINGQQVRLLDIVDLVLKSNIGTSRYTVIGQGTIDQMILAGPAEVKSLVDEASGVKTYYLKRDKSLRRLEQTAQNLMRAEDLMAEIEPRLKSLRRQAKKMESRKELEQELRLLQREYFGKTFWLIKEQIDGYQKQIDALMASQLSLESSQKTLRAKAEELETGNHGQLDKYRQIQQHLEHLQKQKNKLLEELSLVRGKMQSHKTAAAGDPRTLQVEAHTLAKKLEEVKKQIEKTNQEQDEYRLKLAEQQQILTELKDRLAQLYVQVQGGAGRLDWEAFEQEFFSLDEIITRFYQSLENNRPWQEVQGIAVSLRQQYARFKNVVKETVLDPHRINQVQQQIAVLQNQKEEMDQVLQSLQTGLSKTEIYLNFLHKDQESLEQQKLHLDLELKKAVSHSVDDFFKELLEEELRIQRQVDGLVKEIAEVEGLFKNQQEEQSRLQKDLHQLEMSLRDGQDSLSKLKDKIAVLSVEKAKYDTQMEVLTDEIKRLLGEEILSNIADTQVENRTPDLENRIQRLKNQLDMIGGMDELTMKEYQETEARYTSLSVQVEDLKRSIQDLRNIIEELDEHIKVKFNEAFHRINEKFEQYFRILFNGGRAYLSVVRDETAKAADDIGDDEAEAVDKAVNLRPEEKLVAKYEHGASNIIGIEIKATPPGKKLSAIQALSGGERSLTSIALLCSLLTCFPSPFVVLDEVDAALDDANTIRFGQILGTLSNQTQFLTITHNRETMAQANILYGVTMGDDGVSKLLSVKLEQAKAFAK